MSAFSQEEEVGCCPSATVDTGLMRKVGCFEEEEREGTYSEHVLENSI